MGKLLKIARNAFTETIRQPAFMIILAGAAFMISFSPSYAMFTLMEDAKLLQDMGLATMLAAGLAQAVFSACKVVSSEIENRTIFTVLTKPVSKGHIVAGKFLGIALACSLSLYLLSLLLVMALRVGVPEAAYSPINRPLIYGQVAAFAAALVVSAFLNYFNDRPFGASLFVFSFIAFSLVFVIFGFLDADMSFQAFLADADLQVLKAAYLLLGAVFVMSAAAVAFAVRFGAVITACMGASLFVIGLLSDHIFGRFAGENMLAAAAYSVFPNMQVFWAADAVSEGIHVPAEYLLASTLYSVLFSAAAVVFGVLLFEQRESV